jgi:heme a synthase
VLVGAYSIVAARLAAAWRPGDATKWLAWVLAALFGAQMIVGVINVALLAPIYMQLIHLFMADMVWIALVLAAATALTERAPAREPAAAAPALQPGKP